MEWQAWRPPRVLRLPRFRDTPGRVRALGALVLLSLAALCLATGLGMADARDALASIGDEEGPMVVATGDVYRALSDMDAQVTNVLLTGAEEGWLCDADRDGVPCQRRAPRYYYDIRREDAQRAMQQAAQLAEGDQVQMNTVLAVLDGLNQYDLRVQSAMENGGQSDHAYGELPADAAADYRAATTLMTENLLPKAGNLTLAGAAVVDSTYEDKREAVLWARTRVLLLGAATVAALLSLQVYLGVRFRRVVSPLLALATALALGLTVAGASMLATEADRLRTAKERGFDPLLTVSRTQALGKTLDADRTRFLLDPDASDRHDQTYLEKSQAIFYISGVGDLSTYYTELDKLLADYRADPRRPAFGGYYGAQARTATTDAQRRDLDQLLAAYQAYQRNDRRVRALAERGRRGEAGRAHLDPDVTSLPHPSFREHDRRLDAAVGNHRYTVDRAASSGADLLADWRRWLPAWALAIAALVVAGVWPRLREYLGRPPAEDVPSQVPVTVAADGQEGG